VCEYVRVCVCVHVCVNACVSMNMCIFIHDRVCLICVGVWVGVYACMRITIREICLDICSIKKCNV
jgi:hypothetical protein